MALFMAPMEIYTSIYINLSSALSLINVSFLNVSIRVITKSINWGVIICVPSFLEWLSIILFIVDIPGGL